MNSVTHTRQSNIIWGIVTVIFVLFLVFLHFGHALSGMDALLLCAFYLCIFQIRIKRTGFYGDYISREATTAINGIFIMLVLFTHAHGYLDVTQDTMPLFFWFRGHCRQLVVTTFLFFSGYGVMESIAKKGTSYVRSLPIKRVLPLWIKFMIAVCIFAVIALCFGETVTVSRFILSLLTWSTIGNSNWYVTAILVLYLIAFFSFRAFGDQSQKAAAAVSVILTFVFLMILIRTRGTDTWYYNTLFCFPAGIIYSQIKERVEMLVQHSRVSWWSSLIISLLIFGMAYLICDNYGRYWNLFWYQIMCIVFVMCIIILSMKVKIGNRVLLFLGGPMLFSIYILMRVPMNIFSRGVWNLSPVVFFVLSVAVTLVIAWIFTKATNGLIKVLIR